MAVGVLLKGLIAIVFPGRQQPESTWSLPGKCGARQTWQRLRIPTGLLAFLGDCRALACACHLAESAVLQFHDP